MKKNFRFRFTLTKAMDFVVSANRRADKSGLLSM